MKAYNSWLKNVLKLNGIKLLALFQCNYSDKLVCICLSANFRINVQQTIFLNKLKADFCVAEVGFLFYKSYIIEGFSVM
ncbi:hypothetical protein ACJDTP_01840 [Clostridium sp. WILCCON 0112]|uniref:Uncharacterized protein n=1 Tax=Candidatus Clostridium helianthi TaxID=3381660 RepID=A0ABW8RYV7_9CLOT